MLQEDSNGDTSFEIIDKKTEVATSNEATESTSSISGFSSPYSIPSPSGNLLSNVLPPSTLPDIALWPTPTVTVVPTVGPNVKPTPTVVQPFPAPQFSAAIPPSKGFQPGPMPLQQPPGQVEDTSQSGGGLIGWMKDAVSTGGLLSKVAEKAKNSVDSIITTLDPQMSEFIYSGGDFEITVASQDQDEISSIRDAVHAIFGKAWVNGSDVKFAEKKFVAVGFDQGFKSTDDKIEASLEKHKTPTVAIENIILEIEESWFDLNVLILKDVEKQITLKGFTQSTPIPVDQLLYEAERELPNYSESDSVENILTAYLKYKPDWVQSLSGVSRKDAIFLAAKNLVKIYKDKIVLN